MKIGNIQVHSSEGTFFASAVGQELTVVTERLLGLMRQRLNRWKAKRFPKENIRTKEERYDTSVA